MQQDDCSVVLRPILRDKLRHWRSLEIAFCWQKKSLTWTDVTVYSLLECWW